MQGVIEVLHRIFLNPSRTVTYTQDISEKFLLSISNQFIDTILKNILLFLRAHTEVRASNFRICKSYSKPILVLYLLSVSCLLFSTEITSLVGGIFPQETLITQCCNESSGRRQRSCCFKCMNRWQGCEFFTVSLWHTPSRYMLYSERRDRNQYYTQKFKINLSSPPTGLNRSSYPDSPIPMVMSCFISLKNQHMPSFWRRKGEESGTTCIYA